MPVTIKEEVLQVHDKHQVNVRIRDKNHYVFIIITDLKTGRHLDCR